MPLTAFGINMIIQNRFIIHNLPTRTIENKNVIEKVDSVDPNNQIVNETKTSNITTISIE